eukprot:1266990-Rhodomonas_salina.3
MLRPAGMDAVKMQYGDEMTEEVAPVSAAEAVLQVHSHAPSYAEPGSDIPSPCSTRRYVRCGKRGARA